MQAIKYYEELKFYAIRMFDRNYQQLAKCGS